MKTSKFIFLINVLAIVAFTLQTCKPEEEHKTYGPYTLGEGSDYINFKPGSWWVYQNSKSGLYDTLVLKSISIKSQTFVGKNTVIKDVVSYKIVSQTFGDEYQFYNLFTPNPDLATKYLSFPFIDIAYGKTNKSGYYGEVVSFFYPFDSTYVGGTGSHNSYYKGFDSTYILKGKTYFSVRKFYIDHDATWDSWWVNYYWAKDVGLIRRENIKLEESWNLINYYVEKP